MNLPYSAPVRSNRSIVMCMAVIAAIAILYLVFLQVGASQSSLRMIPAPQAGIRQAVPSVQPAPQVVPVPVAPRAASQPAQINVTPVPADIQSRPVPQPVATPPAQP